jgi:hypothetical protein
MRPWLVPVAGAVSLIVGFGVAQLTGNRPLGGFVLLLGGAWCAWQWWRAVGAARTLLGVVIFAVAFALSHPLGIVIGAWPSVLLVAVVAAVLTYVLCAPKTSAMS